ncbi:MAG: Omp28 family outer membrane lipoprotein [Prevotellaceae bacterium]|nr:Omp28 family outer membrane lipoprotein [Prevotellaceae bacterium]MDY6131682.1 Omp28 family outer membrane lipoprotein [Prevotella sp.]
MKKLIYILIGMALALTSCSEIDESERLEYVKPAEVGRKILIEDFTGQKCVNCPKAVEEIEKLQKEYGADNIIAVGIHSGPLGYRGNEKNVGLATETGDEYFKHWGIEYQPQGLVNRQGGRLAHTSWAKAVHDAISQKAPLTIDISNTYNEANHSVAIDVKATGVEGSISGKLQVWILEDGIVAMQKMPDGTTKSDYVHNHVFRTSVNNLWGDDVTLREGETKKSTYTLTLDKKWVADRLTVVAFVYNDNGVQQVEKKSIK